MTTQEITSRRYCGRDFTAEELAWISQLIDSNPHLHRKALSKRVCEELDWLRVDGRLKDMSCRVAMLRMERDGLIELPPPRKKNGNGRRRPQITKISDPREEITLPAGKLGDLAFEVVEGRKDSRLWNEFIERYHYLGYQPLPGAQLRYFVQAGGEPVALLGLGAAAWTVAPRDEFIGWDREERVENLHLVVNNARFLILPWVRSRNLASRVLGALGHRIRDDWEERYAYRPVLMETFVDSHRFKGICYRAANWVHVGRTKGRGKLDREHRHAVPMKDVFVYPLVKGFRKSLRRERP